jgi:hypothetical protein
VASAPVPDATGLHFMSVIGQGKLFGGFYDTLDSMEPWFCESGLALDERSMGAFEASREKSISYINRIRGRGFIVCRFTNRQFTTQISKPYSRTVLAYVDGGMEARC